MWILQQQDEALGTRTRCSIIHKEVSDGLWLGLESIQVVKKPLKFKPLACNALGLLMK